MVRPRSAPLLDTRLRFTTPGYPAGAALGLMYFVGFQRTWLAARAELPTRPGIRAAAVGACGDAVRVGVGGVG